MCVFCLLFMINIGLSQVIEMPSHVRVSLYEPEGLFVQWRIVPDFQRNPILGYKIRLWKIDETHHVSFTHLNNERLSVVSDERMIEPYNIEIHKNPPQEYIVPQEDIKNDLSIKIKDGISYNTVYDVRVLAYRKDKDGPMSEPIRVKIIKGEGYLVLAQRTTLNSCMVTVSSDGIPENGESYYNIETVNL